MSQRDMPNSSENGGANHLGALICVGTVARAPGGAMTITIAISVATAVGSRGGSFRALRVNRVIEEPVHHLFPGLFAETHGFRRVGVLRILRRIIVMGDGI